MQMVGCKAIALTAAALHIALATALSSGQESSRPTVGSAAAHAVQEIHRRGKCCIGPRRGGVCWSINADGRPYRILFHGNEFGERGTETSRFDYAHYFEEMACGRSYVAANKHGNMASLDVFQARFPGRVFLVDNVTTIQSIVRDHAIDAVYTIQAGFAVEPYLQQSGALLLIHGVFSGTEAGPAGAKTAVISSSVQRASGVPVVPHMVEPVGLPRRPDLRSELGIGDGAMVFCRHGGKTVFNVPIALEAVCRDAARRPDHYYVFMNTNTWHCAQSLSNIMFVPMDTSKAGKHRFLSACDACIHARQDGETFGLAVAECSNAGLPIITWAGVSLAEDFHLRVLGPLATLYATADELTQILDAFNADTAIMRKAAYKAAYARFAPKTVMLDFLLEFGILGDVVDAAIGTKKVHSMYSERPA